MVARNETKFIVLAEDRASPSLANITRGMQSMESQAHLATSALAAVGFTFSAAAAMTFVKSTIDAADSMNDLSQRVGIAVKDLGGWQLAADSSGTSMEAVAKGVKGLSGYMHDHGKELKAAGITANDAGGAMTQLADIFKAMPDGVEKTNLAVKLFGKAGMDLLPMMNLGSQGLAEMREKAAEYGKAMAELAPQADALNDQFEELGLQSKIAGINMAALVTGPIAGWLEAQNQANRISGSMTESLRLFVFNLDAMTTEKPREEINRLTKEVEKFKKEMESELRAPFIDGKLIADHGKKIEFLKFLERQQAMSGAAKLGDYRDARDMRLTNGGTMSAAEALARARTLNPAGGAAGGGRSKKASSDFGPDDVLYNIEEAVRKQNRDFIIESQKAEDAVTAKTSADNLQRLNSLLAATPTGQLQKAREEMQLLAAALEAGTIKEWQFVEAVGVHYGKSSEALEQMNEFAIAGARSMQDAFADFLFDPFSDKTDSMLEKFGTMLRKMAAQAAAAQLSEALFGDMGKSGKVGGLAGELFKSAIGAFGGGYGDTAGLAAGVPQYEQGTPWVPNDGLAYLHKGEQVIPAGQRGGGVNIVINNTVASDVTATATARQNSGGMEIEVIVQRAIAKDMARNGPITQGLGSMFGLQRAL